MQWRLACACVAGWARGGVGTTRSDDVRIAQVADATREGGEGLTVTVTAPTYSACVSIRCEATWLKGVLLLR